MKVGQIREIWPNFFIVGAPKAGTTSLYHYLKEINGVYMSPVKEPSYFGRRAVQKEVFDPTSHKFRKRIIEDKSEYLALFSNGVNYNARGEATPTYLWDPDAPYLIKKQVPNAHIIIILRDPVERAFSDYLMKTKHSKDKSSFYSELLNDYEKKDKVYGSGDLYVELGMYYEQVKRYFEVFGRNNVKVIIFEEFIRDKERTVNEVLSFLGIHHIVTRVNETAYLPYSVPKTRFSLWIYAFFRWMHTHNIKLYKIVNLFPDSWTESLPEKYLFKREAKPSIEPQAVEFLKSKYKEDLIHLQQLLGRKLPWPTARDIE